MNYSWSAVSSKSPRPKVQHNPIQTASHPVAPGRRLSAVLIRPQAAKRRNQIQGTEASKRTRRQSHPKSGPSYAFVDVEKSLEPDSGFQSSSSPTINPEKTVSIYDPGKKMVVGRISLEKVK